MAKHIWSVLCYKGVLDQYTNQVSLLDVVEGITAKLLAPAPTGEGREVQVPLQGLMLVTLWTRSDLAVPEEATTRVRMIVPGGASRRPNVVKVDLTKHVRSRSFMRFESLPFHGNGYYYFVVEVQEEQTDEWHIVAELPLEFRLEQQPTMTPEVAPAPSESPATQ